MVEHVVGRSPISQPLRIHSSGHHHIHIRNRKEHLLVSPDPHYVKEHLYTTGSERQSLIAVSNQFILHVVINPRASESMPKQAKAHHYANHFSGLSLGPCAAGIVPVTCRCSSASNRKRNPLRFFLRVPARVWNVFDRRCVCCYVAERGGHAQGWWTTIADDRRGEAVRRCEA